jgi:hypothetical protein
MWKFKGRKKSADKEKPLKKGRGHKPRPFQFEALEPRLLLSADIVLPVADAKLIPGVLPPVVAEVANHQGAAVQAGDNLNPAGLGKPSNGDGVKNMHIQGSLVLPGVLPGTSDPSQPQMGNAGRADAARQAPAAILTLESNSRELVIIDSSVPD